jgi:hypothetical protein
MNLCEAIRTKNIKNVEIALDAISKFDIEDKLALFKTPTASQMNPFVETTKNDCPIEILKLLIEYCINNGYWYNDSKDTTHEPQLCRFATHGTVDHLKMLFDIGKIQDDEECTKELFGGDMNYQYLGDTALKSAVKSKSREKVNYLIVTYEYTTQEIIDAIQCASKIKDIDPNIIIALSMKLVDLVNGVLKVLDIVNKKSETQESGAPEVQEPESAPASSSMSVSSAAGTDASAAGYGHTRGSVTSAAGTHPNITVVICDEELLVTQHTNDDGTKDLKQWTRHES